MERARLPDWSREGTKRDKSEGNDMTIRKTGAVTGRVLGVEPNPAEEPGRPPGPEPEDDGFVDRPLQGRQAPPAADGDDD